MYRRNSLATVLATTIKENLYKHLLKHTRNNLTTAPLKNRHIFTRDIRCLCGHTAVHRKTSYVHQSTHSPRCLIALETMGDKHGCGQDHRGTKYNLWLMLAGTGLFSYSVWKARHVLQDLNKLNNPFIVLAQTEKSEGTSANTPEDEQNIPSYVQYLLIGAGTASHSAMRAIRLRDHKAQVLIVGDEDKNPYSRPPLSKELWFGEKTGVFYDPESYYIDIEDLPEKKYGGTSVLKGRKVVKLDSRKKIAYLDNGVEIKYNKCLIATGGRPKNLPVFEEASQAVKRKVHLFRNIDDFMHLHRLAHVSKSIAVIGGGFLGSELACALEYAGSENGLQVYHIFPGKGVMSRILPDHLSQYATEKIKQEGVEVIAEKSVKSVSYKDKRVVLTLNDGSQVTVDEVVVTVGIQPNDDIARKSDLDIDPDRGGLMVNAELEAKPDIWVAGDVASFFDYKYRRGRGEHHSIADNMGKIAGQNMTGAKKLYEHQPYFWSDLGSDVSYQALGEVDSSLETVSIFVSLPQKYKPAESEKTDQEQETVSLSEKAIMISDLSSTVLNKEDFYQGVVFYCKDGLIVGIVLWNVFGRGKINAAKQILEKNKELKNEDFFELSKLLFRSYAKPS